MPSYNLSNTSTQINSAVSGAYTALFGGGFAGNLRINGTVSGIDASFAALDVTDEIISRNETTLQGNTAISGPLTVSNIGGYTKPQHFNSGILIGRNAAPNFLTPTFVASGVSEFKYPVLIGGWNSSPVLSVSGDASITGSVIARDFTVTGQILPLNEAVSGRIPILQSNTGTFGKVNITGLYNSGAYGLSVAGDSFFGGASNEFTDLYSVTVRCNNFESDGLITANLMTVEEIGATSLDSITVVGQTGRVPMSLIVATGNAPTTSTSNGTLGQIVLKNSKLHVCTGTNQWGTISIGAFSL
jgi:hypothetical protein